MSASEPSAVYFDPYKPDIVSNPYPAYRRMREEAPLYYNKEYNFYALSRFEDVERGLRDPRTYSSARGDVLEYIQSYSEPWPPAILISQDPPIHTAFRGLVQRLFTPKRLNALGNQVRQYCAQCLDPFVGAEGFDFIADLGAKMPMRVIGMLLGIPEQDHELVRQRSDAVLHTEAGKPLERTPTSGEDFAEYIDWRMKNPSDDVMTEMLTTEFADPTGTSRRATREEALLLTTVLATAGNETTNRLIGWMGKALSEHPDQRRQIVENRELIAVAIEEVLRYEPPGPYGGRYVTRDVELYGQTVPAGSAMLLMLGSANRDDRRFADGDRFDISRQRVAHLTFGNGIHTCVGSVLARLEGRTALEEILKRFPEWEVDLDNAVMSPTSAVRGWQSLPVRLPRSSLGRTTSLASRRAEGLASPPAAASSCASAARDSVEGRWTVTIKAPTGPMVTALILDNANGVLTGTQTGQGSTSPISEAKFDGENITWVNEVTKPIKLKVEFSGTVAGSTMSGKAKAGFMGSYTFTAVKA